MKTIYLYIYIYIVIQNVAFCQLFLPATISKKIIEGEDIRIDLLGNGSYYNQPESGSNNAASGGVLISIPTKNKSFLCLSAKGNPLTQKAFLVRDSSFNTKNYLPDVSKRIFGFENTSNYNFGLRYNHVKEKPNPSKKGIWGFIGDFNITSYKTTPDSIYWAGLDTTFTRNNTLSQGFYLLNPTIGATREWLISGGKKDYQNIKISLGLWLAATFVYEHDAGKGIIPAYNYLVLGDNAINKNFSLNQKIKSFYAGLFSMAFELNDFRFFCNIQYNQVLFKPSELEIKGVNNRPLFINFGAGFSPSLIHFNF